MATIDEIAKKYGAKIEGSMMTEKSENSGNVSPETNRFVAKAIW